METTLVIDIETSPNLAHVWGLFNQNISLSQLRESTEMICFSAKWLGKPRVEFRSVFHDGKDVMIERAYALVNDADVLMHYNGRKFDVPHLNREFLQAGLKPPAPFKQIDLCEAVKRQFRFPSSKLAYVSKALGLDGKLETGGHELWVACMAGDEKAWRKMRQYNKRDVTLLEDLYGLLRPWIPNHPSLAALSGESVCTRCGSGNLERRGFALTVQGKYQRFQCKDCGSWSRDTKSVSMVSIREVAQS